LTVEDLSGDEDVAWAPGTKRTPGPAGKILCWILTYPGAHDTKARAVNETWGRNCDYLLFVTSAPHATLPTLVVDLKGPDAYNRLWIKSKRAWEHVYEHYLDKAEWFMKADDDTYVVWDNLVRFLAQKNTSRAVFFGRLLYRNGKPSRPFNHGGGGIILSREALRRLGEAVFADPAVWFGPDRGSEDVYTSDTLRPLGVELEASLDEEQRQYFMALNIRSERFMKRNSHWFWEYSLDAKTGPGCCSEHWITSHYMPAHDMYTIDAVEKAACNSDPTKFPFLRIARKTA
jgi:glycoprotein-N-acetylgalactosamine 3-beta-galactosyltransferase